MDSYARWVAGQVRERVGSFTSNIPEWLREPLIPLAYAQTNFGVTSTGSATYPSTNLGKTDTGATSNNINAGDIKAYKYTLSVPGTVVSLSIYIASYAAGAKIRVGVYSDSAGAPNTLVAGGDEWTVNATGWKTITLATPVYFAAADYWISFLNEKTPGTAIGLKATTPAGTQRFKATTNDTMPATWPSGDSSSSYNDSFYMTYVQIEGYTKGTRVQYTGATTGNGAVSSFSFYTHTGAAGDHFTGSFYSDMGGNDANTVLLLPMQGVDASTTFTDVSTSAHTITENGNAQIDTAQSKFGGASGLFDGTGDYLSTPDSADWYFGTGAFTIDFWLRYSSAAVKVPFVSQAVDSTHVWIFRFDSTDSSKLQFLNYPGSATISISGTHGMSANTWYHVALIRGWGGDANSWAITVNGSPIATATNANEVTDYAAPLQIAADVGNNNLYLNGWIDEFRVSKGVACWASNFTPPTAPYGEAYQRLWYSASTGSASTTWNTVTYASGTTDNSWAGALTQNAYYWFMWQWDNTDSGPSYAVGGANTGIYLAQAYGTLLSTWSGGTLSTENWSMYLTYSATTNYSRSLSDAWTGTSSVLRSATVSRLPSDSNAYASVISRTYSGSRAPTGAASLAEVLTRAATAVRNIASASTYSSQLVRTFSGTRTPNESFNVADAVTGTYGAIRSILDSPSFSETITRLFSGGRSPQDTQTYAATMTRVYAGTRLASAASDYGEAIARTFTGSRSPSDSAVFTDIFERIFAGGRNFVDTWGSTDNVLRVFSGARVAQDSSTYSEALTRTFTGARMPTESSTVTESITRLFSGARAISSAPSFTEAVTRVYTGSRAPTESFSVSETLIRAFSGARTPQDAHDYASAITRSYSGTRTASESSIFADAIARVYSTIRSLSDAPAFTEAMTRVFGGVRTASDSWSNIDSVLRPFSGTRLPQDSNNYSDSLQRTYGVSRGLSDSSIFTELVARLASITRNISSPFNIVSSLQRFASYTRNLSSTTQYIAALVATYTAGPPVTPPSGGGGGITIKPLPTTVMVGAVFPRSIYFLLPGARVSQDMTISNPSGATRQVTVHYTLTNIATGKVVYEDTVKRDVPKGSITYTVQAVVTETGRYRIDITAVDGGTATALQEFDVGVWQIWQGPILLWSIIAFVAAALILFYKRIEEEW